MIFINLTYSFLKSNKSLVSVYLLVTILDSIVALVTVLCLVPVIQYMTSEESSQIIGAMSFYYNILSFLRIDFTFINSLLIFLSMTILSSISSIFLFYISRVSGYAIVFKLRSWALYKFYGQGLSFINSYSFGIMQNTFEREINKVADAIYSVLNLVSLTIFTLLMISFSIQLSQTMTLLIIASFLVFALFSSLIGSKISSLSAITVSTANIMSSKLYSPLLNAKNVLSFAREKWAYETHAYAFKKHVKAALKSQTLAFSLPELFKTLSILVAILALFFSLSRGESLTLLIATLAVFIRMLPKLASYTAAYAMIKAALPSVTQYENLFPKEKNQADITKGRKISSLQSSIELKNLSFSYSDRKNILVNVNLKINKNSFVSFIGHSGSGKTTCADIILGLYSPNSGSVLIDGCELDQIDLTSYLDLVGYVQQDAILLDGSVRDNLLWANPKADSDEMWESLRLVSIDIFIKSLPDGIDTLVGERGVALSGGQKQRIALALALIRKPQILILDEVTSALDHESENIIRQSLKSLSHKLTIISVTHRPSMAEHSDKVYVFDKGLIVESGSYKELKKNNWLTE